MLRVKAMHSLTSFSSVTALFNSIMKRKSISNFVEVNACEGSKLHFLGDGSKRGFLVAQTVKNSPAMQHTRV